MNWHKTELAADTVKAFADKYGCDLLTASILLRRGISSGEDIRYFLETDLRHLRNPFDLPGMEDAVERILAAKEEGEKVMVFGDRDTDGITGTALLTDFLRRSGFDVRWALPAQGEPYGLSERAVEAFAADYGTLIITVDCGISNRKEITRAAELGITTVVTDHHNPPEKLPPAYAIVNPKLPGKNSGGGNSAYSFPYLSGCAVAYKLVSALRFAMKSEVQKKEAFFNDDDGADLQLAALSTIGDIMPLKDENRLIVRKGLESLAAKPRPGLAALLKKLGLAAAGLNAEDVSWQLTPAINASGRMGSPEKAVELLLSEDPQEREALAGELAAMNEERKAMVEEICFRAEPEARKSLAAYSQNMVLFADRDILPGLTGLVAGRLADRFNVPALVVSFTGGVIKGSFRSARKYPLGFLLDQCAPLFLNYGGHDFAAGFSMEETNREALEKRLAAAAANMELPPEDGVLELDAELPLSYLSRLVDDPKEKGKQELYLLKIIDRFEPYGEENRPLVFLSRGLKISGIKLVGRDELKHVKLTLDTGGLQWPGIYWNAADRVRTEFDTGDTVDIVYTAGKNWYDGTVSPQLTIKDLEVQK